MTLRLDVDGRSAVVRQAPRNHQLRRVLAAYFVFNVAEWGTWIALSVWGYGEDGALDRESFLSSVTSVATSLEVAETHIRDTYL